MLTRAYLGAVLVAAVPAFPQAASPINSAPLPNDTQMATPPPVSGQTYPTAVGAEENSNYIRGGIAFNTSYIDNLYPDNGVTTAETTYSILPALRLDQTTPTRHITVLYSPGFTFYEPSSTLNQADETANLRYQVRLSPHSVFAVGDELRYSSTAFGSGIPSENGVSGATPVIVPGIIAPFAKELANSADGEYTLQTSLRSMIGFGGTAGTLHFPDPTEASGLYDSSSRGGSAFYNHRISEGQYLGAIYGYTSVFSYPPKTQIVANVQSFSGFYTFYPKRTLSLTISGGPQDLQLKEVSFPASSSWSPFLTASIAWQGHHTNFAVSYAQAVTAGGGLIGPYHSRSANAASRWQMWRTWTAGLNANYSINKAVSAPFAIGSENGHSISGSASVTHPIGRKISISFDYDRIHQSYGGIPAISNNPDANRVSGSISWEFMRPLGR